MANNLSSRIAALERSRGALLPPLLICTYNDMPMTMEQEAEAAEARTAGRLVIEIVNAPPD